MDRALNGVAKVDKVIKKKQILVRDLRWDSSVDDIKDTIERELEIVGEYMEINISKKENSKGLKYAIVTMTEETAIALLQRRRLAVKWDRCRIQELYKPSRCYKCYKMGHFTGECKEREQITAKCLRCCQTGHTVSECKNEPHCVACNCAGHRDDSMACPNYRNLVKKMKQESISNGY